MLTLTYRVAKTKRTLLGSRIQEIDEEDRRKLFLLTYLPSLLVTMLDEETVM